MLRSARIGIVVAGGLMACGGDGGGSTRDSAADVVFDAPAGDDTTAGETGHRDLPSAEVVDTRCGVSAADYFDRLIAALDAFYGRCSAGDRLNLWEHPLNRRWMLEGTVRPVEAQYAVRFASGKLRVDEASACTYLSLLAGGDCNATRLLSSGLVGDAGAGGACAVDEECPAGFFCRFGSVTACEGVCTAQVGEGEACDPGGCLPGTRCRLDASDQYHCAAAAFLREPGQPCDAAKDVCVRSVCDGATCRELPGPGSTCSAGQYCQGGWCDRTLNLCMAPVGAGNPCEAWDRCQDGHYCTPFPSEFCQPRLALESECDPTRNSFDFPGVSLACASGLCDRVRSRCTTEPPAPACD